jgi:hypothetical protein
MTSGETPDVGLYFRPIFMRNSHVIPQVARRSAVYGARHGYGPGSVIGLAFRTAFMGEVASAQGDEEALPGFGGRGSGPVGPGRLDGLGPHRGGARRCCFRRAVRRGVEDRDFHAGA